MTGKGKGQELDLDEPKVKSAARFLKDIDFELAYLTLLTRFGIKPLSRWEKGLSPEALEKLGELGLVTKKIKRTVKIGKEITEYVFSMSGGYIELYADKFSGKPIDKSAETLRFEGFLFGYPPCCVEQYIRHRYVKNELEQEQQKILFHWACKDCKITEQLLPVYKKIHDFLSRI